MSKKNIFVGIDASLTNTGISFLELYGKNQLKIKSYSLCPKKKFAKGQNWEIFRLQWLQHNILNLLSKYSSSHIVSSIAIEDYAYGVKNSRSLFGLAELGGVIKTSLYPNYSSIITVSPTTLKKFITGKGNASKQRVMHCLNNYYNLSYTDNNQADATALSILCYFVKYKSTCKTPFCCTDILDKVRVID